MTPAARPLWQRFLIFLLPLMLANILQSMSGTINNIYVGQLLGVESLAAVSLFFPIMFFLIAFVIGISAGATVLIGQAWGAGEIDRVKEVIGTTLTTTFLAGIIVACLGTIFIDRIMLVLGAPLNILDDAARYARVMLVGMPVFFIFLIATSVLRGVGDTVTPLYALTLSIVVGLTVTPALIQGWMGLPQIGVSAAAVATILGSTASLTFLVLYLRLRGHPIAPDAVLLRHLRVRMPTLLTVLRIGIPTAIQTAAASVAAIVVVGLVNQFGSDATAAYGAVNQVLNYVQFPAISIGIAASIFAAQAIGAGQSGRLPGITRTALLTNLGLTGGLIALAYAFSRDLMALFIKNPDVVDVAQTLLHIVLGSVVLFGASSILAGVMRASGAVIMPMLFSLGAILLVQLPTAVLLSRTALGLHGIWWGYVASFSTMLALNAWYYLRVWKRQPIQKL